MLLLLLFSQGRKCSMTTLDIPVPSFDFAKKQPRAEIGFTAKSYGTIATSVFASYNTHVPFRSKDSFCLRVQKMIWAPPCCHQPTHQDLNVEGWSIIDIITWYCSPQLYKEIELCSKITKVIQFDRDESCMIGYGRNFFSSWFIFLFFHFISLLTMVLLLGGLNGLEGYFSSYNSINKANTCFFFFLFLPTLLSTVEIPAVYF